MVWVLNCVTVGADRIILEGVTVGADRIILEDGFSLVNFQYY